MPVADLISPDSFVGLSDLVKRVLAQVKRAQQKAEFERDRIKFNFIDTQIRAMVVVAGGRSKARRHFV